MKEANLKIVKCMILTDFLDKVKLETKKIAMCSEGQMAGWVGGAQGTFRAVKF